MQLRKTRVAQEVVFEVRVIGAKWALQQINNSNKCIKNDSWNWM